MQTIVKDCSTCVYGLTCSTSDNGERTDERDDCLRVEWYTRYELGDPILRRRELQFSGKINIVLSGEHEINRTWDYNTTYDHLVRTCEAVGLMTYRHPTVPNAIRCEISFGPAFDLFFSEDRKTLLRITKSTQHQKDMNFIDFDYHEGLEMDYR